MDERRPASNPLRKGEAPPADIGYDLAIKARNLEDEIRELERSLNNPLAKALLAKNNVLLGGHRMADEQRLKALKRRLAAIDPNSALVD